MSSSPASSTCKVGLFVTCLVDLFRPSVGFATVKLLEDAGCEVFVPVSQTCCGQPAFNSGDDNDAKEIAVSVIKAFEEFDYVVAPSGSCAGMLKKHYPELFKDIPNWEDRADDFARKVYEITSFLVEVLGVEAVDARWEGKATYHDSCSGLRELGIASQPRKLLETVEGLELVPLEGNNVCCGFGGTFAVKYGEVSNAIVSSKTENITKSNADLLLAGDLGCLLNMGGKLKRQGSTVQVRHVVEVLAGMTDTKPIGGKQGD